MSVRKTALRGSAVLATSEGVSYGMSFIRNMILARMLTRADFGIAATFAMMITLLEFSSKLGVARFVVRDKEGGQADFLAAAQGDGTGSIPSFIPRRGDSWHKRHATAVPDAGADQDKYTEPIPGRSLLGKNR